MARVASLALALFIFWLLLSGHGDVWLVASGAVAAIAIAWAGSEIGYADAEGHPVEWLPRGLVYWPWLIGEVAKSALSVSRIILSPSLPISPRLIRVRPGQKTAVGVVVYANSITLTPGTITVEVDRHDRSFLVHALTGEGAEGVESGEMDRKVSAFEGSG